MSALAYISIWFVFTLTAAGGEPTGYIPTQDVRPLDMSCGLPGAVVGINVDRLINPTKALWPDPGFAGLHCEVSIAARVQALAPGEYHLATTEHGTEAPFGTVLQPYIGIDPHTSATWRRTDDTLPVTPLRPGTVVVVPPPQ